MYGCLPLTLENILYHVDEYNIFRRYCSNFKHINQKFLSELREERSPSCVINKYKGRLYYKDFGVSGKGMSCISYITQKYGDTYFQALSRIASDFNLKDIECNNSSSTNHTILYETPNIPDSTKTIIQVKRRRWRKMDVEFWTDRYGIELERLEKHKIRAVSHLWINEVPIYVGSMRRAYDYYYYYNDGVHRRKIYQPDSKYKFISNVDSTIVQGIKNIPKSGELLIITSSYKDVLVLETLGYNSIAPNNEISFIPDHVLHKLKNRYHRIVVFFDNDFNKEVNTGLVQSKLFSDRYNLRYILIPAEYGAKDVSDFREKYGFKSTQELVKRLIG
jgi:hypothetical protein